MAVSREDKAKMAVTAEVIRKASRTVFDLETAALFLRWDDEYRIWERGERDKPPMEPA